MDQITDDKLSWALWEAVEYANIAQFIFGENFDEFHPDAPQWIHLRNFMTPGAVQSTEANHRSSFDDGTAPRLRWENESALTEFTFETNRIGDYEELILVVCLQGVAASSEDGGIPIYRSAVLSFWFDVDGLVIPLLRANGVREVVSTSELVPCEIGS